MKIGDRVFDLIPVQSDGGGIHLIEPTAMPDYPTDGPMDLELHDQLEKNRRARRLSEHDARNHIVD